MAEPAQKPGRSKQDYGTPLALIRAVETRWGLISVDLAAHAENAKAARFITEAESSRALAWHKFGGLLWLNPPFADIEPWAEKCKAESARGASIIMLTPASVGSNWFAKHCDGDCRVVFLRPRLTFEGCKDPYPKDCMLTLWHPPISGHGFGGYQLWDWRASTITDDRFDRVRVGYRQGDLFAPASEVAP